MWISENDAVIRVERISEAEERALEALALCPRVGADVERDALYALGWARSLRGLAIDDVCERFHAVSDAATYMAASPDRVAGQRLMWRGDVDEARSVLTRLLSLADERDEPSPTRCSACTSASSRSARAPGTRRRDCSPSGASRPTASC